MAARAKARQQRTFTVVVMALLVCTATAAVDANCPPSGTRGRRGGGAGLRYEVGFAPQRALRRRARLPRLRVREPIKIALGISCGQFVIAYVD